MHLLEDPGYCELIDAIGVEDLFTNGKKRQQNSAYTLGFLRHATAKALPV